MLIDHVAAVVPDAAEAAERLRESHGLGSEQGPYFPFAGTRAYNVPLRPPAYLELHAVEDRAVAETSVSGRAALAREASGFGLFGWAVLAEDLESISARLDIEIRDFTIDHGDGTLRGFRAVDGSPHLPFFVDYPNNGDRRDRWQAMYERVGHTSAPAGFSRLTISGSAREMEDWLGPNDLPLMFVDGSEGILEARIATTRGELIIS